ncbi:MFS transporter [Nonomuraea sp. NBC_00507]|uniref:MFS transporter n=1 Tax=Nonomuraea sp. NBC_00507 TaxID=2976002 RepID=UPI002E17D534
MLDNMIVGTAMPRIVGELGGLYGRKGIFIISIVIFMIGSALCGMAGSSLFGGPDGGMAELIAFRAVQGLGAGGLMVNVMAIIGDLVPPRERGQYQGIMAGVMSLAMIAGPLVGGFITDHLDWRWAFYVNLPVGAVALVLIVTNLHLPKLHNTVRIDWAGATLLSISITAMVLITTWGGNEYPWGSWQILGLAALAVLTLAAFVLVERKAAEPIMPLQLFRNRNFTLISAIGFLLGFASSARSTSCRCSSRPCRAPAPPTPACCSCR